MDIRTLPEKEREIYNRIRARYKLTFDKLTVKEQTVRLLKVADIEEFLDGKDPFANVTEFPFWVKLWEAAMVLSYVLPLFRNPRGRSCWKSELDSEPRDWLLLPVVLTSLFLTMKISSWISRR